MANMVIGKSLNTNADVAVMMPTVIVCTGEAVSGKRFLSRTMISKKDTGRVIVITNNPDSFHGLGESFVKISEEVDMDIKDRVTVFNCSCFYDSDPKHILDARMAKLHESIREDDLVIINDAYPFLTDDVNHQAMIKAIEGAWKIGATILFATTETETLLERAPELLHLCEYLMVFKQDEKDALSIIEAFDNDDRGKYEYEKIRKLMEFGQGLLIGRDETVDFVQVG